MARTTLASQKGLAKTTGLLIGLTGLGMLFLPFALPSILKLESAVYWTLGAISVGCLIYIHYAYKGRLEGIKNNGVWHNGLSNRGALGWLVAMALTGFYVALYFYPKTLGYDPEGNGGIVALFDPLSKVLNGKAATQWFVYGTLYTLAILVFGVKFIYKYKGNRYQIFRTLSVMFFQLGFAFLLPEFLSLMHADTPYFAKDIKNMWPLNYYFFESWHLKNMLQGGGLGMFMLLSGLAMIFIVSPILTYKYGKRWYCSWVCGCGALAETAGDPFRQLSSKKISVWKLERWMIHVVLVFIFLTTIALIWSFLRTNGDMVGIQKESFVYFIVAFLGIVMGAIYYFKRKELDKDAVYTMISLGVIIGGILSIQAFSGERNILFINSYTLSKWYGFGVGAAFSGVLGVGFYPILGSRVWCRFGCPMAAILGLQQRLFSRFRITTNGGQCISCGNCSAYCEMGIDVRAYAQKGQNIVRSSCVGCGICSAVCPRGVLKLENGAVANRTAAPRFPLGNNIELN